MSFRIVYSHTSREQIRALHPSIKPSVKESIQKLLEDPYMGKALERELSGYFSYRTKRYRIIYKIAPSEQSIQIYHIGHRKDIYELFKELLEKD